MNIVIEGCQRNASLELKEGMKSYDKESDAALIETLLYTALNPETYSYLTRAVQKRTAEERIAELLMEREEGQPVLVLHHENGMQIYEQSLDTVIKAARISHMDDLEDLEIGSLDDDNDSPS